LKIESQKPGAGSGAGAGPEETVIGCGCKRGSACIESSISETSAAETQAKLKGALIQTSKW